MTFSTDPDLAGVPPTQGVNPPKQARSAATFQRILDAAEALMRERSFDDISVFEICAAARVSVSSLYSRFDSKQAILATLCDEMARRSVERLRGTLDEMRMQHESGGQLDLSHLALASVQTYLALLQENSRLVTSLQSYPDLWHQHLRQNNAMIRSTAESFLRRVDISDPALVDRIVFVAAVIGSACQRIALDGAPLDDLGLSPDKFAHELSRLATSYFASPSE